MSTYYKQKKDYEIEVDRKLAKKGTKRKAMIEQQRLKKVDQSEEEELDNEDIREEAPKKKVRISAPGVDSDEEMGSSADDEDVFVNPLAVAAAKKKKETRPTGEGEVSEGEWSDEDGEGKDGDKKKKGDKKLGKRKRKGEEEDEVANFFDSRDIEVVPQENYDDESMDSDDMAETRALAKLMLRKKARTEILNGTYNRYANHDDPSVLPDWFLDDEARHFRPNTHVTKDMVAAEKKILQAYNERPSKKVQEAKARKKKRLAKAMNKIKQKA